MPNSTPTQRLDALEPRVKHLEDAVQADSTQPKARWPERLWRSFIVHPFQNSAVTLFLFLLTLICTQINGWLGEKVDHRVGSILNKPQGIIDKVDKLQATANETNTKLSTLQPFIEDLVRHEFDKVSKLSVQQLGERLPFVGNLASAAKAQNVRINPSTTKNISDALLRVNNTEVGYWPTATKVINLKFASQEVDDQVDLPDCADTQPIPATLAGAVIPSSEAQTIPINPVTYTHCAFTLDSQRDIDVVNHLLLYEAFAVLFRECKIVYRGGQIKLISIPSGPIQRHMYIGGKNPEWVTGTFNGNPITFVSCSFDFSVPRSPSEPAQAITRNLLAQNGSEVKLPFQPS